MIESLSERIGRVRLLFYEALCPDGRRRLDSQGRSSTVTAGEFIIIVVFGGIIVSVAVVFVLCVAGAIFEHRHNKSGGRPWCSITIGTMEGRSIGLKHVMSAARYQEQVDKLRSNGVQVPTLIPREEHY